MRVKVWLSFKDYQDRVPPEVIDGVDFMDTPGGVLYVLHYISGGSISFPASSVVVEVKPT